MIIFYKKEKGKKTIFCFNFVYVRRAAVLKEKRMGKGGEITTLRGLGPS